MVSGIGCCTIWFLCVLLRWAYWWQKRCGRAFATCSGFTGGRPGGGGGGTHHHWRQLVVLGEVLLLFIVGFLPQEQNLLANAIVSFSCAMQVQAFRKVNGYAFASTMCIGDLRSGVEAFCIWSKTHEPKVKDRMMRYFGIILLFAVGAGIGSMGAARLAGKTIWISCGLLLVSFALMFIREEIEENPAIEKDLAEIRQETREIDRTLKQELKEEREELHEELHEKLR